MQRTITKMRGMRLSEATYKAVVQAARIRDYASPSAFMRAVVEKELRGADATLDESEQRIRASLERWGGWLGRYYEELRESMYDLGGSKERSRIRSLSLER